MDSLVTRQNLMELLVEEEVHRQVRLLPRSLKAFLKASLKLTEIISRALSQLPSFYASSEEALPYQLSIGRMVFGTRICKVVQAAIWVVQEMPACFHTPLPISLSPKKPSTTTQRLRYNKVQPFVPANASASPPPDFQQFASPINRTTFWVDADRLRKAEACSNAPRDLWNPAFC